MFPVEAVDVEEENLSYCSGTPNSYQCSTDAPLGDDDDNDDDGDDDDDETFVIFLSADTRPPGATASSPPPPNTNYHQRHRRCTGGEGHDDDDALTYTTAFTNVRAAYTCAADIYAWPFTTRRTSAGDVWIYITARNLLAAFETLARGVAALLFLRRAQTHAGLVRLTYTLAEALALHEQLHRRARPQDLRVARQAYYQFYYSYATTT